jgi:hypothetical protein
LIKQQKIAAQGSRTGNINNFRRIFADKIRFGPQQIIAFPPYNSPPKALFFFWQADQASTPRRTTLCNWNKEGKEIWKKNLRPKAIIRKKKRQGRGLLTAESVQEVVSSKLADEKREGSKQGLDRLNGESTK